MGASTRCILIAVLCMMCVLFVVGAPAPSKKDAAAKRPKLLAQPSFALVTARNMRIMAKKVNQMARKSQYAFKLRRERIKRARQQSISFILDKFTRKKGGDPWSFRLDGDDPQEPHMQRVHFPRFSSIVGTAYKDGCIEDTSWACPLKRYKYCSKASVARSTQSTVGACQRWCQSQASKDNVSGRGCDYDARVRQCRLLLQCTKRMIKPNDLRWFSDRANKKVPVLYAAACVKKVKSRFAKIVAPRDDKYEYECKMAQKGRCTAPALQRMRTKSRWAKCIPRLTSARKVTSSWACRAWCELNLVAEGATRDKMMCQWHLSTGKCCAIEKKMCPEQARSKETLAFTTTTCVKRNIAGHPTPKGKQAFYKYKCGIKRGQVCLQSPCISPLATKLTTAACSAYCSQWMRDVTNNRGSPDRGCMWKATDRQCCVMANCEKPRRKLKDRHYAAGTCKKLEYLIPKAPPGKEFAYRCPLKYNTDCADSKFKVVKKSRPMTKKQCTQHCANWSTDNPWLAGYGCRWQHSNQICTLVRGCKKTMRRKGFDSAACHHSALKKKVVQCGSRASETAALKLGLSLSPLASVGQGSKGVARDWRWLRHNYGRPSFTLERRLCVVTGMLRAFAPFRNPIAVLPPSCRPNKRLIFSLDDMAKAVRVDVLPDGQIRHLGATSGKKKLSRFFSLDGIVFATSSQKRLIPRFGWNNDGIPFGLMSFTVSGSLCELEGRLSGGSWKKSVTRLPGYCRPTKRLMFYLNNDRGPCRIDVLPNGQVRPWCGKKANAVSLSGIVFVRRVHSARSRTRKVLKLLQGFRNIQASKYGVATSERSGRLCILRGVVTAPGSAWGKAMLRLPANCRPAGKLAFNVVNQQGSSRVWVKENGDVSWVSGGTRGLDRRTGKRGFLSLAGIVFPIGKRRKTKKRKQRLHKWGYGGYKCKSCATYKWPKLYKTCGGRKQSPINIISGNALAGGKHGGELKFQFRAAKRKSLTVQNNGHTVKVSGNGLAGDHTTLAGKRYDLVQFHFHRGSEHRVDGKQFALEAQFVHKDGAGNYLVVAVLFNIGPNNGAVRRLPWSRLTQEGRPMPVESSINPIAVLPTSRKDYFFYDGSFTTPPCTEGVKWVVLKKYQTVSNSFATIWFPFNNNFRPTQPLNGRIVISNGVAPKWGYRSQDGPNTWGSKFAACKSKFQSPIDISTKAVVGSPKHPDELEMFFSTAASNSLTAVNNGHTIKVSGKGLANAAATLAGKKYRLVQFHFHAGSETRVNKRQFPLEAQFVHQRKDTGEYLVVAVLFKVGSENPIVPKLRFADLKKEGSSVKLAGRIELKKLLPTATSKTGNGGFYFYEGSFTTPPCTEGVKWVVMKRYQTIIAKTLKTFPFNGNFRPPQPLNGRKVLWNRVHQGHHKWGYSSLRGPKTWALQYSACKGKRQSPINIVTKATVKGKPALQIKFVTAAKGSLKVQNNGHTLKVSGKGLDKDKTKLAGRTYDLVQFNFHAGSEHRVDGKQFPLEAHFVHRDRHMGTYLVVAVLFKIGRDNAAVRKLGFGKRQKEGLPMALDAAINPMAVLPRIWKDYYSYDGSFTTPPCTEGVKWVVLKNYQTISQKTVSAFPFKKNFRPPQPLNGRKVVSHM